MEPTKKAPGIEQFLSTLLGTSREGLIRANKCAPKPIGCGAQLTGTAADFRDDLSIKEYSISGLCQKCQDRVFGVSEEN